jgi:centromeric protein E
MRVLEKRIAGAGETIANNASPAEMQKIIAKLMSQCNEKAFELEIKSADNRILQEQLHSAFRTANTTQGSILQ